MHTIWSRMLLLFIYVRRWRLSCIVAVYCKYSFTMGSSWPFLSRIRYPLHEFVWGYIVNLASPPIINTMLKPAYQSNQPIVHVSLCHTVGLKIGAHFYFVSLISQRVFNFRSPTIAYDNPQLQQIVISYSIFDGEYVAVKLWGDTKFITAFWQVHYPGFCRLQEQKGICK